MVEGCKFPATLFSPTKMIYIAYVILSCLRVSQWHSLRLFAVVSVIFWVVEIFHDDYLRIWLNKKAEKN
jgi:hypothetical protein